MFKKAFISLALIVAVFAAMLLPAFAVSTARLDELAAELEDSKVQQDQIEDNIELQEEKKQNAAQQLAITEEQIELLLIDITEQRTAISAKQQQIDIKMLDIATSEVLLGERLRAMYITRNTGTLSILLSATSFSDFLTAADSVQRVAKADNELIVELNNQRKDLEVQEEALQAQLLDLEEKQHQLEQAKSDYGSALQLADESLDSLNAESEAASIENDRIMAEYEAAKAEYEAARAETGANSTGEYVGGDWAWPVPGYPRISSQFGMRLLNGIWDDHIGIDIATEWDVQESIHGKPIVASNSGTVVRAIYSGSGYGNYLMIDHGGGMVTLYGHCNSLAVSNGATVSQGQIIAYVGNTGNSFGSHLHFEIVQGGDAVNPEPLLPPYSSR